MSRIRDNVSKIFVEVFKTQLVSKPTRGNSVLDFVLRKRQGVVSDVRVGPPVGSSDHATVTFRLLANFLKIEKLRWILHFISADYNQTGKYLFIIDWIGIVNSG